MKNRRKRKAVLTTITLVLCMGVLCVPALAAGGDVAGAVQEAWKSAATQIKTVVDTVVFPALDMILAIAFFGKLGMTYFDYRKHGQFEWTGPVILFACLIFTLTAPICVWKSIGRCDSKSTTTLGVKTVVHLGLCCLHSSQRHR